MVVDSFGSSLGVGGIRSESFARALTERGVAVEVVARKGPTSGGGGGRITFTGAAKVRAARSLRGSLPRFTPDLEMARWRPLIPKLRTFLAQRPDTVLYSSGPPHSTHVAVLEARGSQDWFVDLRDPFPTGRWQIVQKKLDRAEKNVCEEASFVIAATRPLAEILRARYPGARVRLVENGFPDTMLPLKAQPLRSGAPLRVGLAGVVVARYLRRLVEVLGSVAVELGEVEIVYYGPSAAEFRGIEAGPGVKVTIHPPVLQTEVIDALSTCSLLANARGPQVSQSFSSKYFEFVALGIPILAVGANDDEASWLSDIPFAVLDDLSMEATAVAGAVVQQIESYRPDAMQRWLDDRATGFSRGARWSSFLDGGFEFPGPDREAGVTHHLLDELG